MSATKHARVLIKGRIRLIYDFFGESHVRWEFKEIVFVYILNSEISCSN